MEQREFSVTLADYTITLTALQLGRDLFVSITGGDVPHIGTLTSYAKEGVLSLQQFPSHSGRVHKDNVLAERVLTTIKPYLQGNCVLTAGVHVDGITKEQIQASFTMVDQLAEKLAQWLKTEQIMTPLPQYKKS
ncbi:hypothetical protein [Ligilactobacillus apodemi]|uniref:Prenylated flavin chaperone LpdD-like domain-containing protein n=1 Tax=Ligilactobacillus apodemi DSM 16634 = JCM 16172 TaxID=1423724 RepID=A0A0R1TU65_9LACO|nr:hypothetical protein [Ligilactobacillus apodemi]KRL84848.1 hypothetical protein FC32_GL000329 [Ligilactobacillus apodemi DSM 16634 = JCM 16172]